MILAMGAARSGIPLIMVSGDDELEKEIRRHLPWVKCAVIKHAVDRSKAEPVAREEASRRIEAGDFEAGYRASLRLISTAGLVGRLQAYQRVLNAQPNAADLRRAVSDTVDDRWIHPWPISLSQSGAARTFWGAR